MNFFGTVTAYSQARSEEITVVCLKGFQECFPEQEVRRLCILDDRSETILVLSCEIFN